MTDHLFLPCWEGFETHFLRDMFAPGVSLCSTTHTKRSKYFRARLFILGNSLRLELREITSRRKIRLPFLHLRLKCILISAPFVVRSRFSGGLFLPLYSLDSFNQIAPRCYTNRKMLLTNVKMELPGIAQFWYFNSRHLIDCPDSFGCVAGEAVTIML